MRILGYLLMFTILSGCGVRRTAVRPAAVPLKDPGPTFVDLQPGWDVRVVSPILKSGGYKLDFVASSESTSGSAITIKTTDNFLGYESALYKVEANGKGVRIILDHTEAIRDGVTTRKKDSSLRLFQLPDRTKHVRLVYLQRASGSDHNMALVASNRKKTLEALTRKVQMNPPQCTTEQVDVCTWIPEGIAVRPDPPPISNSK